MGHTDAAYGIGIELHVPFEEAVERVKGAFKEVGFGTLTEIDVQRTLREKLGQEIEPYRILGMCNPRLASRALAAEHEIGLLLPCNVIVHECGGTVRVSAQDPAVMYRVAPNDALQPIAAEARQGIDRALAALAGEG